ncbi:Protein of unknown function [Yoonia rosea]|uniref:DUF2783 domain-containing protein n=1 Tax=Yoonia rosea TaxID=287098 RepID=A0A1R3WDX4_9RHOB|nr:DUF2783 domain-containing protein [Yoonia rosea]SIT76329.1 Protein of unknown function [Yoonia rosea]
MTDLNLDPNIPDHDAFYAELIDLHNGLDAAQSSALNARLILILANHIGDRNVLTQAFAAAKGDAT